jgi:hypothetical protein
MCVRMSEVLERRKPIEDRRREEMRQRMPSK